MARKKFPHVDFDYQAWAHGTRVLTAAEKGDYITIMCEIWDAPDYAIELNLDRLRTVLGCYHRSEAKKRIDVLIAANKLFIGSDGRLHNGRADRDAGEIEQRSPERSSGDHPGDQAQSPPNLGSISAKNPTKATNDGANARQNVEPKPAHEQEATLFPQESFPPDPLSKNTPISPSVSVARKRATKPKVSKKTFVLVRDQLETVLSADMAQAVIQHRNITIKKPLTPLAATQLVEEFRKAEDAGIAPDVSAGLMIRKGWRGFEADWAIPRTARSPPYGSPVPPAAEKTVSDEIDDYIAELKAKEKKSTNG